MASQWSVVPSSTTATREALQKLCDGLHATILLVRNPLRIVLSYFKANVVVTEEDVGISELFEIHKFTKTTGKPMVVIDNETVLSKPEKSLRLLCEAIGLSFQPSMMSWPLGGIPEDGPWAFHWYKGTHARTTFENGLIFLDEDEIRLSLPQKACNLVDEVKEMYELVAKESILRTL